MRQRSQISVSANESDRVMSNGEAIITDAVVRMLSYVEGNHTKTSHREVIVVGSHGVEGYTAIRESKGPV